MAIMKRFKPTSPARRYYDVLTDKELSKERPQRRLTEALSSQAGRNNDGVITSRHRGGGHRRKYRRIDFKRDKANIPATVAALEYDPNRSAHLALLNYVDGEKRYILAPKSLKVGSQVISGDQVEIENGNCLPLKHIPVGAVVHNVEIKKGRGGQIVRSAGSSAQILGRENGYVQLRLPSTEVRRVLEDCRATIGEVGNANHGNISIGKAGRKRWLGIRPRVRGVAMNPVDHPHGGGQGKSKGGNHPTSPWGWHCKGMKMRNNKRTDRYIITRRKKSKKVTG